MDLLLFVLGMIVLGAAVGMVSGALGVGGGLLMVPAFVTFVAGMDINTAKGSSLLIISFVAANNSWRMNRGETKSPWDVIGLVASGSVIGGYLGGWFTGRMSDTTVTWIFVALIAFAALRTFLLRPRTVHEEDVQRHRLLSVIIGLASGIVAGATGTGGGAILVPLVLWAGIASNERVVALSNTVMVATCLAGTLAHLLAEPTVDLAWTYGMVTVTMAPMVIVGALLGAPLGRRINAKLDLRKRSLVMGALLLIIAVRLAYRALT